jgi:uncharacterized protein DUF1801
MPEAKTKLTARSVSDFLDALKDEQTRKDCQAIAKVMQGATKAEPRMWGSSIVGFGTRLVTYASGKQAEWMQIGFSPRKQNIALYLAMGDLARQEPMLAKLGKCDHGKGCLYIKRLADVNVPMLEKLVQASVEKRKKGSPAGKKK